MWFHGPSTSRINIENFTQQYLTLSGCVWHLEACNPPKLVIQNNNNMNVCNNEYLLLKKTTLYIVFGTEKGAEPLY